MALKGFDIDFKRLFEHIPGLYLILSYDLLIIAVSDSYLKATMTKREEIIGRDLFDVFPDNPNDLQADGVSNLLASLNFVRNNKRIHKMAIQKYDIRRPDDSFEIRYWSPTNSPILDENGEIIYIVHQVEDVSEFMLIKDENIKGQKIKKGLQSKLDELQLEIIERSKEIQKMNNELEQKVIDRTIAIQQAETSYREIFENATDAIYIHEIETGKLIEVNNRACEITGYSKEELLNSNPQDFITDHPDYSFEKALEYIQKAAEGFPQHFEWLGKNKDGTNNWFEVYLKQAYIAGKERILAFFREINERKKNEEKIRQLNEDLELKVKERTLQLEKNIEQLRESEEKFEKAFHASPAAISITRISDTTYLDVNENFIKLVGYNKEDIIGKTSIDLGLIVDLENREKALLQLKKDKTIKNMEMRVQNRFGKKFDVLTSIETITYGGENYAINIIYDISERKISEEQLSLVNKELESFTYSISHDLRAPLRAVNGYAEMLFEDYGSHFDDEGKRVLSNIKHYANKMGILIDDLLAFSRLGKKDLLKVEIKTNELVEGVLIDLNKSLEHNAKLKVNHLATIKADYGLIHQVFFNLISNAIKYSSKKHAPKIKISSKEDGQEIIFSVEDNGAGFDMKYYDKLFGVFQRLHSQEEFNGTGVGLAIVQRIISKHGGRVWAEGKVDHGATFYFSLPKK